MWTADITKVKQFKTMLKEKCKGYRGLEFRRYFGIRDTDTEGYAIIKRTVSNYMYGIIILIKDNADLSSDRFSIEYKRFNWIEDEDKFRWFGYRDGTDMQYYRTLSTWDCIDQILEKTFNRR